MTSDERRNAMRIARVHRESVEAFHRIPRHPDPHHHDDDPWRPGENPPPRTDFVPPEELPATGDLNPEELAIFHELVVLGLENDPEIMDLVGLDPEGLEDERTGQDDPSPTSSAIHVFVNGDPFDPETSPEWDFWDDWDEFTPSEPVILEGADEATDELKLELLVRERHTKSLRYERWRPTNPKKPWAYKKARRFSLRYALDRVIGPEETEDEVPEALPPEEDEDLGVNFDVVPEPMEAEIEIEVAETTETLVFTDCDTVFVLTMTTLITTVSVTVRPARVRPIEVFALDNDLLGPLLDAFATGMLPVPGRYGVAMEVPA